MSAHWKSPTVFYEYPETGPGDSQGYDLSSQMTGFHPKSPIYKSAKSQLKN